MARRKSELLSALGMSFEILKAIVDEVLDLGGSDEDMRRILKEEGLRKRIGQLLVEVVRPTFKVVVDSSQSLSEMISAGKYNWVNSDITAERFPISGQGRQEKELVLFHFGKAMTSEQVIAEMDKAGCRPGKIEKLLALGAAHPDLQKQFPIVAIGSVWRDPDGDDCVPCLCCSGGGRGLDLRWFGGDWRGGCRFLGLRK